MTESIAGRVGERDEVRIPEISLWKMLRRVYDFDERHADLDRHIKFNAIRDEGGINVSEAVINTVTLNGVQVDEEVRVIYRNGLFRRATIQADGETVTLHRLSAVLRHLDYGAPHG